MDDTNEVTTGVESTELVPVTTEVVDAEVVSESDPETPAASEETKPPKRKNLKNEWLFAGILMFVSLAMAVGLYILQGSFIGPAGIVLVGVVAGYMVLGRNKDKKKKEREGLEREFIEAFSYFSVYIQNGFPVYKALEMTAGFATPGIAVLLRELMEGIDNDKGLGPYMEFADRFDSPEVRQVMIAISRMVDEGGSSLYVEQFRFMFSSIALAKRKDAREKVLAKMSSLTALPLLSSGLSIILVTLGVLAIMGGYASGF